jgi:hypothetical protein
MSSCNKEHRFRRDVLAAGVARQRRHVPTQLALGHLPKTAVANASGLFNLMRNLGGAIGIAVIQLGWSYAEIATAFGRRFWRRTSAFGANRTSSDVRGSVATGGESGHDKDGPIWSRMDPSETSGTRLLGSSRDWFAPSRGEPKQR